MNGSCENDHEVIVDRLYAYDDIGVFEVVDTRDNKIENSEQNCNKNKKSSKKSNKNIKNCFTK